MDCAVYDVILKEESWGQALRKGQSGARQFQLGHEAAWLAIKPSMSDKM